VDQAADRIHRIGQLEKVTIHYLIAAGTIEEDIAYLLDSKRKVLSMLIDGQGVDRSILLSELMKENKSTRGTFTTEELERLMDKKTKELEEILKQKSVLSELLRKNA
jgi:SNF2 family DNA or RNA helicase